MERNEKRTEPAAGARVDMHCHSSASQISKLGVQRAVGLPECATPPQEVYELAKRRGMDFVTITDHDTIAGVLEIVERPDVFISEELTAHFRGEPQAVHVLCYGISPEDHEWLQRSRGDVEACAAYMHERDIVCALAHPYYTVGAPLSARHRRRLAQLFAIWEVRNGARSRELNRPAATYVGALDGAGIGGSDDHAGVDVGRTWTETPPAATPSEFLAAVRAGQVKARGSQGSAAKWAHAAIALAARALGTGEAQAGSPDPAVVMRMVTRLLSEADARHGAVGSDLRPQDARCLLRAWLAAVELDHLDAAGLIAYMQEEGFSHLDLYRRARRVHERKLRSAVEQGVRAARGEVTLSAAAVNVFDSCMAAIPYAPATAFLANEHAKLDARREDGENPRVAIVADGIGSTHGVTRVIEEIRQRGVHGFEIEILGTDPGVDRRLSAVAELDVPYYPGLRIGVPSLSAAVQTLADGAFDVIHACSPGPVGIAGALVSRGMGLPLLGSYHTELAAYAGLRSGERRLADAVGWGVGAFYRACDLVLSPSPASDAALAELGVRAERVARWDRGVDSERFDPRLRDEDLLPGAVNVLYAGRVTREKGVELLIDAFLRARARDERLQLVLAGGGPEEQLVRERVGEAATFLGWLEGEELARTYASADVLLFPSRTDTFGQVILEAQASGLPVLAVAAGGPLSLIEQRVSGLLCAPEEGLLAEALIELAGAPLLRERLARAGLHAARERTWEAALERLGAGYRSALRANDGQRAPRAA
ncbi:MAG TPA: glycosyltransferase [Solirubrobacteraceae bacterium]|jgi:glycosyltransferase involved in cell wall biosynthesis/predicted metal-dependent phosphoesterase TrpH|nr:glycosyltransferase [Solirubrobacteraceae bacterium]